MTKFLKNIYHFLIALAGVVVYRFPSRKIFVLGVTGTKGKSSVVELVRAILEEAGKKTAMISSVHTHIAGEDFKNPTSMTMPGRAYLQKFLRRAVGAGCEYAILEVTSQGVLQYRHRFIDFDAAMIINIHPEHIEAHGGFEAYRAAKVRFFSDMRRSRKSRKYFFINEMMPGKEFFENGAGAAGDIIYFSREDFINQDLKNHYNLESDAAKKMISGWLRSDFNLENAAAAVAFAKSRGISEEVIFRALEKFKGVPGRMEYVMRQPFSVVVDYAHTPDSLRAVYRALFDDLFADRAVGGEKKRMICVLGSAGGGRDKWKRSEMGAAAAEYCSQIVLTDEDPYDEPPQSIIDEIEQGIKEYQRENQSDATVFKILDRRLAIKKAIASAHEKDVVILTGKGSEGWIHLAKGKKIPWNERGVAEELLKEGI